MHCPNAFKFQRFLRRYCYIVSIIQFLEEQEEMCRISVNMATGENLHSCCACRRAEEETLAVKNALIGADARLSLVETLEATVMKKTAEVKACQAEKRSREEELATERSRTQHLVRVSMGKSWTLRMNNSTFV